MNSTVTEFQSVIGSLNGELNAYKNEQRDLKSQLTKLIASSRKLSDELKQSVLMRISDEKIIKNLEQQLKTAVELKNTIDFSGRPVNVAESEKFESNEVFERRITEVREHYSKGLEILSKELTEAHNQVTSFKQDNVLKARELNESEIELKKSREEALANKPLVENKNIEINYLKDQLLAANTLQHSNEQQLITFRAEISALKDENCNLKKKNEQLVLKVLELERENAVFDKNRKKYQLEVQEATLQRKAAIFREKLTTTFVDNLKASIDQQIEHALSKNKHEIKSLKKECDAKVLNLMNEISELHSENSKKQSTFERAVRERNAIDSKLRAMMTNDSSVVSSALFDDICMKLAHSEKSKDEAVLKLQSLENTLHDLQQCKNKEMQYLADEITSLKQQCEVQKRELVELLGEKLSLVKQMACLKKKCSSLEKQLLFIESQKDKEIETVKEIFMKEKHVLELKLKTSEEQYRKNISDFYELFHDQCHISKKLKSALQDLTVKSELKIKEMFHDVVELQKQKEQLSQMLRK